MWDNECMKICGTEVNVWFHHHLWCFYCSFTVHNCYFGVCVCVGCVCVCVCAHVHVCVCQEVQTICIRNHSLVTANSIVSQVSSALSQCGLWIAPHNCKDTFTLLFTNVHTDKWRPVRTTLRYSKFVKCPAPSCAPFLYLFDHSITVW